MLGRIENSKLREAVVTLLICIALSAASECLSLFVPFTSALPLYSCGLIVLALKVPWRTGVVACIMATLNLDYFFTEPLHTLRLLSGQDFAALASFLAVVLLTCRLSKQLAQRNEELTELERSQTALRNIAERGIQADWRGFISEELCKAVQQSFRLRSVAIWDVSEQRVACSGEMSQSDEALRAALMAERDFDLPKSNVSIRILRSGVRSIGSMQLEGTLPDSYVMDAVASLVSLTLERSQALNGEVSAQSETLSEQLRSSVLDGLAHSIKTPLTTIAVSTAGVLAIGGLASTQERLLQRIDTQVDRIKNLADRLLHTARLDSRFVVKRSAVNMSEVTNSVIESFEGRERFLLMSCEEPIVANTDRDLVRMALTQIVENALKYGEPDAPIRIDISSDQHHSHIAVRNEGPHVPPAEAALIFKRFYRAQGSERRAPGTGLGLYVAKHAIEALGGQIAVASDKSFTTFTIIIPL